MSLTIYISKGARPKPKSVSKAEVVSHARKLNLPNAEKATGVATACIECDAELNGIEWAKRPPRSPTEFRFRTGELRLKVISKIYIANNLPSDCEHVIAAEHEHDHVRDYMSPVFRKQMKDKIKDNNVFKEIFLKRKWYPMSLYESTKKKIVATIFEISSGLFNEEARKRDTQAEYDRINTRIQKCKDKYYHQVATGETLRKLASRYYGQRRFWRTIYEANKGQIGRDYVIHRGQRLLIPKIP